MAVPTGSISLSNLATTLGYGAGAVNLGFSSSNSIGEPLSNIVLPDTYYPGDPVSLDSPGGTVFGYDTAIALIVALQFPGAAGHYARNEAQNFIWTSNHAGFAITYPAGYTIDCKFENFNGEKNPITVSVYCNASAAYAAVFGSLSLSIDLTINP